MHAHLIDARSTQSISHTFSRMKRDDVLAVLRGLVHTYRTTGDLTALASARIIAGTL